MIGVLIGAVDEFAVVVLEPVAVHRAVVALGRQVLAGGAVQVQAHRHRPRRAAFGDPDLHRAVGASHRGRRPCQLLQLDGAATQVERGRRVGGVLHQRPGDTSRRLHVGRPGAPRRGVVVESRTRRNHRAQVHVHSFQLAGGVELHPRRQVQDQLAAGSRTQRVVGELGCRDAVHDALLAGGPQHHGADGAPRMRVGQGVQPSAGAAGVAAGTVTGLTAAVRDYRRASRRLILGGRSRHLIRPQRHRGEWAGAPADARLLDREAAADRMRIFGAVRVAQHVIGYVIAQLIAVAVGVRKAGEIAGGPIRDVVDEDQVARAQPTGGYRDRRFCHQQHVGGAGSTEQERHAAEHLGAEGALQGGRRRERRGQRGAVGIECSVQGKSLQAIRWGSWHGAIIPLR